MRQLKLMIKQTHAANVGCGNRVQVGVSLGGHRGQVTSLVTEKTLKHTHTYTHTHMHTSHLNLISFSHEG